MRSRLISLAVLSCVLATALPARAQVSTAMVCGFSRVATPVAAQVTNGAAVNASQSISNSTASSAPTVPILNAGSVIGAIVYVEQTGIRYRTDGTAPSGNFDGSPILAGQVFEVCGSDLAKIRMIASSTGSNSILRWNFYTQGG